MKEDLLTWPKFVRDARSSRQYWTEWIKARQGEKMPDSLSTEFSLLALTELALHNLPIVEYLIPKQLREQLARATFAPEIKIEDIFYMPFQLMAIALKEDRSNFVVWVWHEGSIWIVAPNTVYPLSVDKTVGEIVSGINEHDRQGGVHYPLALMAYMAGGDHKVIDENMKGSSKKYRNNNFNKVIRGEVGGKFMSALRRYEAQQDADAASRPHGSPRPHIRAGHFHLYWTGKGRTVPKVQFLHPCLVNASSVGDVEIQRTVAV